MASIYAKPNGGPWGADDDEVLLDGYQSYNGFRTASVGNGPSVDGINVNANPPPGDHRGGLVRGSDVHLTRGSDR